MAGPSSGSLARCRGGAWHVVEGLQEIGFGFRALLEF